MVIRGTAGRGKGGNRKKERVNHGLHGLHVPTPQNEVARQAGEHKNHLREIRCADMNKMPLSSTQTKALREIKTKVMDGFPVVDFVLYGSAARGEADEESDVDLMIVVSEPITRFKRHEITDIVFDANLQFGTNFSTLVVDQESWDTGIISVLPLRNEIMRDGIRL